VVDKNLKNNLFDLNLYRGSIDLSRDGDFIFYIIWFNMVTFKIKSFFLQNGAKKRIH
jgi:hypothetical protein